ncbi:MAG: 23S rRNA (guanosine(2251)-2'-O)-methyltransferase RlmB [Acidobacteria bacterium]|nr:MAG: 23S rRNA (guanosine(2251)-2'-O)-methyltransferase RlmB [Acidobacteriota bacterium]
MAKNTGRRKAKGIVLSGFNTVRECFNSPHVQVQELYLRDGLHVKTLDWSIPQKTNITWLKRGDFMLEDLHQGIGCRISAPNWGDYRDYIEKLTNKKKKPILLMLDQVEDPNNLGQILRTCDGAGVDAVLVPDRRSVTLTKAAIQTSQGAFAWVPFFHVGNLRQAIDFIKTKGFWLYACEYTASSRWWFEETYTGPVVLVFGSEGRGMRQLTLQSCDQTIKLPMFGKINSLNVGASVSAVLYEIARQRIKGQGN